MVGGEQQGAARDRAVGDEHAAGGTGGVEDGDRVGGVLVGAVAGGRVGAVGAAAAARVERDHAEVAGEVGDLRLPEPRVDDRPGRKEEERLLALAEHLVADADAARVGVAGLVGREGPGSGVGGVRDQRHGS